jgi:hypothetical protein
MHRLHQGGFRKKPIRIYVEPVSYNLEQIMTFDTTSYQTWYGNTVLAIRL